MMFKESEEGQTHFYGDGCPEHSAATLNDLIAQEMEKIENEFVERPINENTVIVLIANDEELQEFKDALKSLALTVARATAEKLDVEDMNTVHRCSHCDKSSKCRFLDANNAERRRRLQEWLGENI